MSKVILQPVDSDEEFQHYFYTLNNPADLDTIKQYVSPEDYGSLTEIYGSKKVHIWGIIRDSNDANLHEWEKIEPGDIALFSGIDRIFTSAVISYKIHSVDLSIELWSSVQGSKTREFIYFLNELTDRNILYDEFNKIVGYAPNHIIDKFEALDDQKSALILETFITKKEAVTETQTEEVPEEQPSEDVPEEQPPEIDLTDPETLESLLPTSDIEPQTEEVPVEQPPEEVPEEQPPEEAPVEQPPEEQPPEVESIDSEGIEPIDTESETKTKGGRIHLINAILYTTTLICLISAVGYLIYSNIQLRRHSKQYLQEAIKTDIPPKTDLAESLKFDPPKIKWGTTKEQVKTSESLKIAYENDTTILYYGIVADMKATIYYTFTDGKLTECMHHFTKKNTDDNGYILDYKNVKEALTQVYGLPVSDEQLWNGELYKADPQDWGFAIRNGNLGLRSKWKTDTTEIGLGLYSENSEIVHGIHYTNK